MKHPFCYPLLVALVASFCGLIAGCTKQERPPKISSTTFVYPVGLQYTLLDPEVKAVVQVFRGSTALTTHLARSITQAGEPYWGKSIIGPGNDGTDVILVPLKPARDSLFQGFIAIQKDRRRLRFRVYDRRHLPSPGIQQSGPGNFRINHLINAFNHLGFDRKVYDVSDLAGPDLQEALAAGTEATSPQLKTEISGYVQIRKCYYWSACMGDGNGNCISKEYHFSECTTQGAWIGDGGWFPGVDYGLSDGEILGGNQAGGGGGYCLECPDPIARPWVDSQTLLVTGPQSPIEEIIKHLACFDRTQPAQVIFYADQPTRGTTDPVSIFGGIGHAFLTIQQTLDGQVFSRTIGFYPAAFIHPLTKKSSKSALGDDAGRNFDVSWQTSLSAEQLTAMLLAAVGYADTYHINSYNCVNFVIDLAAAAGIQLPRTQDWWLTGKGLNPGAFGEDLRKLPGSNGKPGHSPENQGKCN